jgi:hypothetical protein
MAVFIFTILNRVQIKAIGITSGGKVRVANRPVNGQFGVEGYTWKTQ